ncbi:MAG: DUF481 domain-containing protein [Fidelibacterota bacterium]|nr:MAG: DUF481 domain-containing protein [Candidatus Neomarinimicrobiota bacterium]
MKKSLSRNWCWVVVILWLSPVAISMAQVNTEAMRIEGLSPGFHFNLGGNIGYTDGNSSLFQNRSNLRLDYIHDWGQIFLVSNYRISTKDKLLFINKGFSHLRTVKSLRRSLYGEMFVQKEFNEFINLEDRQLVGGGLRIKWDEMEQVKLFSEHLRLATGIGLMWEREEIDTGPDDTKGDPIHGALASLLRSTNYMVLNWIPKESLAILTTAYFQVDTRRLSDYRILVRTTLKVALTKRLELTIDMNLRHDSEPPGGVKALDLDIANGFSYRFK